MLSNLSGFSVLFEIDVVEDEYKVVILAVDVELVDIVVELNVVVGSCL